MSGTSADGIDVVIAEIDGRPDRPALQQLYFCTHTWPADTRELIFQLFTNQLTTADLCRANFTLAECLADAILETIGVAGLTPQQVDLIGSHGQTIWHDVDQNGDVTSTLQIADPSVIAVRTGITTVANFRTADVASSGQGAPLTSTFDWLLLRPTANETSGGWRAVQNIGGIGNVTLLPPTDVIAAPIAFDTGPGNVLIDWAAARATNGLQTYDIDGKIGASGQVDSTLLEEWLEHPYFTQSLPKTTGRELFSSALAEEWHQSAQAAGLTEADFVATVTELTAASIATSYKHYASKLANDAQIAQVVISGGGARNPVLMERLHQWLGSQVVLCTHEALGIDSDAKEALAFALLAWLTIQGVPGSVPECTGASSAQILGQIAPGKNWHALRDVGR